VTMSTRSSFLVWAVWLALVTGAATLAAQRADPPKRLVSTSPSITETLFALGLGDRVVGVSTYCRFPPEVLRLPKVGAFLAPDAELIARLKPDLVFVNAGPNSAPKQLAALNIRTAVIDRGSFETVPATIRQIGAAVGMPEAAERLVSSSNTRLERVRMAVAGRVPRTVLIVVGRQTGTLRDIIAAGIGPISAKSPRSLAAAMCCRRACDRSIRASRWKPSSASLPT
jgi:iron complex transport system substrate-binding protein